MTSTNKRFSAQGASLLLFLLLLGACAFAHFLASLKMHLAANFALVDDRTIRELKLIAFISSHWWVAVTYIAVSFASLAWLEFRAAPRWTLWTVFSLLALPLIPYALACLHISNKLLYIPAAGG